MKILLVGSGGREHALALKLATSPKCEKLYCAPGNAGIEDCAELAEIQAMDLDGLTKFAVDNNIDFVVVGPEDPLVAGLADRLQEKNITVFGPSAAAAQLEGSKGFTKDLCADYNIPTASYGRFTNLDEATAFIQKTGAPIVVKADGLAAGKGVIIAQTEEEAIEAAQDMLAGNSFGEAGSEIVIEEFLDGEEMSYFALADGETILPLTSAQDHKRAFDGDGGPNTGGMGAYSPAHLMTDELEKKVLDRIIKPTVQGMKEKGCPFKGVLYAGLMIVDNEPYLIEYNVRFGDPECQPIMMRLESDLVDLLYASAQGTLSETNPLQWSENTSLCVVMATKGYPGSYSKNTPIHDVDDFTQSDDLQIIHAGTARDENKNLVSIGGRVLGITAKAPTVQNARDQAYNAIEKINWPDGFYRKDIAWRALEAEKDKAA